MLGNYFSDEFRDLFTIFPKSDFSFTTLYIYPKLVIGPSRRNFYIFFNEVVKNFFFKGPYLLNEYTYGQYINIILY